MGAGRAEGHPGADENGRAAAEVILAQDEGFALVPGVAAADRQAEPVGEIAGRIAEYGEGRGVDIGLGNGGPSSESVEDGRVEHSVGARSELIEAGQALETDALV